MKPIHTALLLTVCILLSACKDTDSNTADSLSVDQTTVTVPKIGQTAQIQLTTDARWSAFSTEPEWCQISQQSGKGSASITITVEPNLEYDSRTAQIVFQTDDAVVEVTVLQLAHNAIIIDSDTLDVESAGGTVSLTLRTTTDISVKIVDAPWLTQTPASRNMEFKTLNLTAQPNTSPVQRTATVIIGCSDKDVADTVVVRQKSDLVIAVSPDSFEASFLGDTLSVAVHHNTTLEIQQPDWITRTDSRTTVDERICFQIAPNEGKARTGSIRFRSTETDVTATVSINQQATPSGVSATRLYCKKATYTFDTGETLRDSWWTSDTAAVYLMDDIKSNARVFSPVSTAVTTQLSGSLTTTSHATDRVFAMFPCDNTACLRRSTLYATLPDVQDGRFVAYMGGSSTGALGSTIDITLEPLYSGLALVLNTPAGLGNVASVTLTGNADEKIAGSVQLNPQTFVGKFTDKSVTAVLRTPINASMFATNIYFNCAPCRFSSGVTFLITDIDGRTATVKFDTPVECRRGEVTTLRTDPTKPKGVMIISGDNTIHIIDIEKSGTSSLCDLWKWTTDELAGQLSSANINRMHTISDCKLVDNRSKLLITSSSGGSMLLDIATRKCEFMSATPNAHSCELLPEGRIAIAMASPTHLLKVYDNDKNQTVLYTVTAESAHGVYWSDKYRRLYSVGGDTLNIFALKDWTGSKPTLERENSVRLPGGNMHELIPYGDDKLMISGANTYVYDIRLGTTVTVPLSGIKAIGAFKSLNLDYNTGRLWYTVADTGETDAWWTFHFFSMYPTAQINASDVRYYKSRVINF